MPEDVPPGQVLDELGDDTIQAFEEQLRGSLVLPDGTEYEDARRVWNGLVNRYPALIARCAGAADVAAAVQFAGEHDLPLSVRGGAHHQTGSAIAESGLVVDCSEMTSVQVDPEAQVAHVEPGTRARDVLHETQQFGLATPTGSAASVGIPGSTLGGGIGWIRRKHGLGIDALRSATVVTADGQLRKASPDHNEDLFWALRGGGGNVGVVTSFEFDLYEVGPEVYGLGVFYPAEHARAVFERLREVMADAPPELTTLALNGHVPPLPSLPADLHGEPAVAVLGCYAGDHGEAQNVTAPLRDVAEPLIDMSGPMPYELLHELGAQMYPDGRNYCHRSVFLDDLAGDALDLVVDGVADAPSPGNGIAVWPLGGAIQDVGDGGAFPWRDRDYMVTVEANWDGTDSTANLEWARETDAAFREAGGDGAYGGFTGVEEGTDEDWSRRVYGPSYDRLAEIKREYDPENLFQLNVNVDPSDA